MASTCSNLQRESSFELLRFISVVLVLALHCNFLSCGEVGIAQINDNWLPSIFRIISQSLCLVCVNVFVLISGWFGIKRRRDGFYNLIGQVCFVTLVCALLAFAFGWSLKGIRDFSGYWFIVAYLGLYVLSPVLNLYLDQSSKRDIIITLCGYGILSFVCGWIYDVASFHRGFSFAHFIWLYLVAGYLRRYGVSFIGRYCSKGWFSFYVLFALLNSCLYCLGIYTNSSMILSRWAQYINPIVISGSVSLFLAFSRLKMNSNFINMLGSSAFMVYLLHTNGFVWKHFLEGAKCIYIYSYDIFCVAYMFVYIAFIVIASILLSKLYRYAYSFLH